MCEFCDYESVSENNLMKHEADVHMRTKRQYVCHECKETFENSRMKDEHIKNYHQRSKFLCDMCDYNATSDALLRTHLEKNHKFTRVNRKRCGYSKEERETNGPCFYWNKGNCTFEDRCRFSHIEFSFCRYDGFCRNSRCK